ncbi:hypothetical protein ACFP9V_24455 [Deinococcus radiopugnans]|uniref:hypothetical protein n=1 Tax=Deinococcus radiopugnans TaxID=57497 RepID=UPI00360C416B
MASLLWPDTPEAAARNNLVHLIRRVNRLAGETLLIADDRVRLSPRVAVDAAALLGAGAGDPDAPGPLLEGWTSTTAPILPTGCSSGASASTTGRRRP